MRIYVCMSTRTNAQPGTCFELSSRYLFLPGFVLDYSCPEALPGAQGPGAPAGEEKDESEDSSDDSSTCSSSLVSTSDAY